VDGRLERSLLILTKYHSVCLGVGGCARIWRPCAAWDNGLCCDRVSVILCALLIQSQYELLNTAELVTWPSQSKQFLQVICV